MRVRVKKCPSLETMKAGSVRGSLCLELLFLSSLVNHPPVSAGCAKWESGANRDIAWGTW